MGVGLNADTDWLNRTTNLGDVGIADWTACGWYYRQSSLTYAQVSDSGICAVSNSSNGRYVTLAFDNRFDDGSNDDPYLCVEDQIGNTPFAALDQPPFDTWVFFILRSGPAAGTLTAEWSALGSGTWKTQTRTNNVEVSVQGEQFLLGRKVVGTAETAHGNYAYWHVYDSEIGQGPSRALKDASTPQNSPWAFWPLADNTDTGDDSGNGRDLTFNGTITSETSPNLNPPTGDPPWNLLRRQMRPAPFKPGIAR